MQDELPNQWVLLIWELWITEERLDSELFYEIKAYSYHT